MLTLLTIGVFAFIGPAAGLLFVLFLAICCAVALARFCFQRKKERQNDPYTPAYDACEKITRERELERMRVERPRRYYLRVAFGFVCLIPIFTFIAAYLPGVLILFLFAIAYAAWKGRKAGVAALDDEPRPKENIPPRETEFFDPGKVYSRDEVVKNLRQNVRDSQARNK